MRTTTVFNGASQNSNLNKSVDKPDIIGLSTDLINRYHGLSRIEDSFKIIKSDLDGRPIYVRKDEHINAHFLICFIALTIIRLLQYKILKSQGEETINTDGWKQGITAQTLKEALNKLEADALSQGYYRINSNGIQALRPLSDALSVEANLRLPIESELRALQQDIIKACAI